MRVRMYVYLFYHVDAFAGKYYTPKNKRPYIHAKRFL